MPLVFGFGAQQKNVFLSTSEALFSLNFTSWTISLGAVVRASLNLGLSYRSGGRRGRRRGVAGGGAAILNSIVYWNRFGGGGGSSSWLMAILGKPAMIYAPSTSSSNSASFASTFLSLHPHYQSSCSNFQHDNLVPCQWLFRRGFISVEMKERQVLHLCNCKRNTSKYFFLNIPQLVW